MREWVLWLVPTTVLGQYVYNQWQPRPVPRSQCSQCGCCNQQQPQYTNPCPSGPPILSGGGVPAYCNWQNANACPSATHWCHVGLNVATTCCCSTGGVDPCTMAVSSGMGQASLPRWYFDASSRTCRQFVYRGLKGNANNFVTQAHCSEKCPVVGNPCPKGDPSVDASGNRHSCSQYNTGACPVGYWCHFGLDADSTACCPPIGYLCVLPMSTGTGTAAVQRWYYNAQAQECQPFTYTGLKGNSNNFLSRLDCENAGCPLWTNPCTQPITRSSAVSCVAGYQSCPFGSWCHVGATTDTTVCCPGVDNVCRQLVAEGEGGASLSRWYYDLRAQTCRPFSYRGLKGNQNNFLSQQGCEAAGCALWENPCQVPLERVNAVSCSTGLCPAGFFCHHGANSDTTICCPIRGDLCQLRAEAGVGEYSLGRWSYDSLSRSCRQFQYRGLKGNQNNFLSLTACQASGCQFWTNPCTQPVERASAIQCSRSIQSCPSGYWCHVGASADTTICCPGARQDVCRLPPVEGEGPANLIRWYADPNQGFCGTCQQFTYRGLKGSQNNFLSRSECEASCPSCENPCQSRPLMGVDGRPRECNPSSPCPNTHWCHIGTSQATTVCCPSDGAPCSQPLELGAGTSAITRWYYIPEDRACRTFQYYGEQGNQNNFLTADDCAALCPVWTNPCVVGEPILDAVSRRPILCSPTIRCPTRTHWCHVGSSTTTTVCCPFGLRVEVGDPCLQPTTLGEGNGALSRWTFDEMSRQCRQFVYRGLRGTSNNFLTREDCLATCYVPPNPCAQGDPLRDPNGAPVVCSPREPCQSTYWCHVGNSPDTTTCCPGAQDPCGLPLVQGTGDGQPLQRWYFDLASGRCRQFVYRGLKGNQNNFLSQSDCRQICPEVNPCSPPDQPQQGPGGESVRCGSIAGGDCAPTHYCHVGANPLSTLCCPRRGNPCDQPLTLGSGSSQLPRYYYDASQDECRSFLYKGLQGNENNFLSESECEAGCPGFRGFCPHGRPLLVNAEPSVCSVETACPTEFVCHINTQPQIAASICCPSPDSFCFLRREPGTCGGEGERRYGYEPASNTCVPFTYSGCGGNLNNFRSLQTCTEICCNQFRRR